MLSVIIQNRFIIKHLLLGFGIFLFLASSCSKDPVRPVTPTPDPPPEDSTFYSKGFFIINEGNFNWGNASITFVENETGSVYQNIFQLVNQRPLGDVAQSMRIMNNRGYIVVNNSNRIEVVDLKDFKTVKSIEGFNAPRFIEFIDSTKAYVTNLYKDISVVDLTTLSITKTIAIPEWTEGLIRYSNYIFVTSIGNFAHPVSKRKPKLLIIDTGLDEIVDSMQISTEPIGIVLDKKMKMWVLCSGGWDHFDEPVLVRIDPDLRQIEKSFTFTGSGIPSRLCINPGGDTLYYLNGGVFQMAVNDQYLPEEPLIPSEGHLFYGLAVHPADGSVFITDAIDYVQNGLAFQYSSSNGTLMHSWEAGTIPGSFCFGEFPYRKSIE